MNTHPLQSGAQLFGAFSGLANTRAPDLDARADEVLAEFESLFIQQWFSAARSAEDVLFADNPLRSSETELQREWLDQRMARRLADQGGLGVADVLRRQLGLDGEAIAPEARTLAQERSRAVPTIAVRSPSGEPVGAVVAEPRRSHGALFESPEAFVAAVRPHAERAARALGVAPEGILAQAALETRWGARVPTMADGGSSLNLFGIKAGSGWEGARARIPTLEHGPEGVRREWADFRAYDSLEAAFDDYVAFLRDAPRYASRLEEAGDARSFGRALQAAGYATDPAYAEKVARVASSERIREHTGAIDGGFGP